jgi:Mg2+ and Co2+ transporter CorA
MLQKQGIIATKTQRDGTVMKVLAFLTALFLPMTFIAVSPEIKLYEDTG